MKRETIRIAAFLTTTLLAINYCGPHASITVEAFVHNGISIPGRFAAATSAQKRGRTCSVLLNQSTTTKTGHNGRQKTETTTPKSNATTQTPQETTQQIQQIVNKTPDPRLPNRLRRSAAGYPRRSHFVDEVEEREKAEKLRSQMASSLGLVEASVRAEQIYSPTLDINPYSVIPPASSPSKQNINYSAVTAQPKKKRRGRPPGSGKGKNVRKGTTNSQSSAILRGAINRKMNESEKPAPKRRGRKPGSKNKPKGLPEMKKEKSSRSPRKKRVNRTSDVAEATKKSLNEAGMKISVNSKALQKFYKSELLTTEEEKSYGNRVQFLMRCEEVHEGLTINLMRSPSIEEWATACGYTDEVDEGFRETSDMIQLRPARDSSELQSPEMDESKKYDSNVPVFVGNVSAGTGVGRGKGRVKKPPRQTLDEIIKQDSILVAVIEDLAAISGRKINCTRGTAIDFVADLSIAKDAKKQMVKSNMRLVISIARRYQKVGVNLQDLVQEGSLGLMRAAEKYDPSRGFKFSTYASWWIQQAVFRAIAYHSRTIRLPVHVHNLLNKARKVRSELQSELGRQPSDDEVASRLGMDPGKLSKILRLTRKSISLEQPRFKQNPKDQGQESEMVVGDVAIVSNPGEADVSPENVVDNNLFHADLEEMLKILGDDERTVIRLRYGMDDGLTRTVTGVSEILNRSKAWVRSQESRALRKLRRPWYEKKLKEHQNSLTS